MTAPFTTVKIRTAAVILNRGEVALIKRVRDNGTQYTLPGGNVEPAEPLLAALRRELDEELGLLLGERATPELIGVQDQMVSRPGSTPPRKLHLIFRVVVDDDQRVALAGVEHDDLSDGDVIWTPLADAAGLHLFPAVGPLLATLDPVQPALSALLPPLTDDTFQWI